VPPLASEQNRDPTRRTTALGHHDIETTIAVEIGQTERPRLASAAKALFTRKRAVALSPQDRHVMRLLIRHHNIQKAIGIDIPARYGGWSIANRKPDRSTKQPSIVFLEPLLPFPQPRHLRS
jgi:hypothetical protein